MVVNMKIRVVGSASMRTEYNSACYMIDDNIMVDFPNGACKYLFRLDIMPSSINHILITHFHGDHFFDMPMYLLEKSKSKNKNVDIYCSKEGKSKIKKLGNLAFPMSYKNISKEVNLNYNFKDTFKVENYEVTKLLVDHGRMKPAYGYLFKDNDRYIGFTGDTTLCPNVELMAQKCSYLFCDCMLPKGNTKHQGIDHLEYLTNKYLNCVFIVSHLNGDTRSKLKEMNIKNVIVPEDGDVIDV